MGFFDDLGKKVTDAGQKTVQKTKEMSEIARINSLISQNESRVNNTYYQIGKLYVSIHGDDNEEEFAGMVATAIELEQQISTYRKQIQDIRGVQCCEKCGAEVPAGVLFCSSCGAPMPKIENQEPIGDCVRCSSCGTLVKKGMRFCTACGQTMTKPGAVSITAAEKSFATIERGAERVCTKCGAKVTDDSDFCSECGNRI